MSYVLVFLGGGVGSILRFSLSKQQFLVFNSFPVSTLIANGISSLILGILMGYLVQKQQLPESNLKLLVATGFCGGFSTFSTFSFETLALLLAGNYKYAFANVVFNILLCVGLVAAGFFLVNIYRS